MHHYYSGRAINAENPSLYRKDSICHDHSSRDRSVTECAFRGETPQPTVMPAIDPAALSRPDSISQPSTALSIKKDIANASLPAPKALKSSVIAPRIDLENIYTNLKAAVGEGWSVYKETMGLFVAGMFSP